MGQFLPDAVPETPQMRSRATMLPCLSAMLVLVAAGTGHADLTYAHENAVEAVTAGLFCRIAPDGAMPGLQGGGQVGMMHAPFPFAQEGDTVASQTGIGIGVVARLAPALRGTLLIAKGRHGDPCCDAQESWITRTRPDGTVWLGHLADASEDLLPGIWQFSLWRGPDEVLSYEITVLPADPEAPPECMLPSS